MNENIYEKVVSAKKFGAMLAPLQKMQKYLILLIY